MAEPKASKKQPAQPKPRPVSVDEQSQVFALLREKMAYKARMTGHTLEDTRIHFQKCTPKNAKRPGEPPAKMNYEIFKIALRRLELDLDPQQVDLITSSLDVKGTGVIDPTDFFQEAHNFRHHRRTPHLGKLRAPNPKPLSPSTWLSPRGRPFDPFRSSASSTRAALLAGVTGKVVSEHSIGSKLAAMPSVSDIVSQTSRVPFPNESGPIHTDYLLKGHGRLASPSSDLQYAAALISPRYTAAPPPQAEVVEAPYYIQARVRAKAAASRIEQPEKWLHRGGQNGWVISLPARSTPAYVHGIVHDMANIPPRHRGSTYTNLGYASSPRVWGDLQRGVVRPVQTVSLARQPTVTPYASHYTAASHAFANSPMHCRMTGLALGARLSDATTARRSPQNAGCEDGSPGKNAEHGRKPGRNRVSEGGAESARAQG